MRLGQRRRGSREGVDLRAKRVGCVVRATLPAGQAGGVCTLSANEAMKAHKRSAKVMP